MHYHALPQIIEHRQVGMDQLVIEFDLFFSQLVVVRVHLVNQLPIEVNQFLEFLFQQASHALLLPLLPLLLTFTLRPTPQIRIHRIIGVQFEDTKGLLSAQTTILAPAHLAQIGTSPRVAILYILKNIVLIDQRETIKTELLLTRSRLVVTMTLIHQLPLRLTHMTGTHLHKRNRAALIKRQLLRTAFYVRLFNH
jgi:hypothetical protein